MSEWKTITVDLSLEGASSEIGSVIDDALAIAFQAGIDSVDELITQYEQEMEDAKDLILELRNDIQLLSENK